MKKTITYLSVCCLFIVNSSFILTSKPELENKTIHPVIIEEPAQKFTTGRQMYEVLCLAEQGLSRQAFDAAFNGYIKLKQQGKIRNERYLTICDFSQSSRRKRFYLIDMESSQLLLRTYVAHGRNSGNEYAANFSNRPSSLQSSLGFYETMNTYHGEHGLSLRVRGLEAGFNDKAYARAIVIHGADYVEENWLSSSKFMGRSYGCPAIPLSESRQIINTIKNGSLLFIYHPTKNYLAKSRILND